jgi:hypothetical protein
MCLEGYPAARTRCLAAATHEYAWRRFHGVRASAARSALLRPRISPNPGQHPDGRGHWQVASHGSRPGDESGYTRPVLKFGVVALGVADVQRQAQFWSAALGYTLREDGFGGWARVLMPPYEAGTASALQLSQTSPQAHPRLHFDLHVADLSEQETEAARLVSAWSSAGRLRQLPGGSGLHRAGRPGREPVLHC